MTFQYKVLLRLEILNTDIVVIIQMTKIKLCSQSLRTDPHWSNFLQLPKPGEREMLMFVNLHVD